MKLTAKASQASPVSCTLLSLHDTSPCGCGHIDSPLIERLKVTLSQAATLIDLFLMEVFQ